MNAPTMPPGDTALQRRFRLSALIFAVALFGYPIVGNLVSMLQMDSRLLSIPYRIAVAGLCLWVLISTGRLVVDLWRFALLLVWTAFLLRLIYDGLIADIGGADYAIQIFLAGCVLPAMALWKLDAYDARRFARLGLITAAFGCLMSLAGTLFGSFGESDLTEITGRLSTVALNPVSLGHLAVSGLFCALVYWRHSDAARHLLLLVVIAMMLVVLVETGSKGPALSLMLGLTLWSLRRGAFIRLMLVAVPLAAVAILSGSNPLAERIAATDEDLSTLDRLFLIQDSLQQIVDYPWIGSAFVELKSGFYAHNILLEAAMSLGLPMTFVLVLVLLRGLAASWSLLSTEYDLIGLLFVQGISTSILAGSMFGATVMWVSLTMALGAVQPRRQNPVTALPAPTDGVVA